MELTLEHLEKIFPSTSLGLLEKFYPHLHSYMLQYAIITPSRMSAFLAQIGHESGAFRYTEEIATGKAYEGRADLGNINPGDGVKYKGRGLIQITGRKNYEAISNDTGIDFLSNPSLLMQPDYAVMSACWYWDSRKLNAICDYPDNWTKLYLGKWRSKFEWITIKVNGGVNGYADRLKYYNRALKVLFRA